MYKNLQTAVVFIAFASSAAAQEPVRISDCEGLKFDNQSTYETALKCIGLLKTEVETLAKTLRQERDEALVQLAAQEDGRGAVTHGSDAHNETYLTSAPVAIPSGAVVAFATECPRDGWSEFEKSRGRFIVGSNPNKTHGYVARDHESIGGVETVKLSPEQMPSHYHTAPFGGANVAVSRPAAGKSVGVRETIESENTSSAGKSESHENMPPSIALYWCKKD